MAAPVVAKVPCSEEDEEEDGGGRKVRGRPRLADMDRVRRRLESRKKYDCRRVYLGEAHEAWLQRRERGTESGGGAWTDAKLAAHLLELEARGRPSEDLRSSAQHKKQQRGSVDNLLSLVMWYCDHRNHCPHEPGLAEVSTGHSLCITASWQCQEGHHFLQELRCPLKTLNQSACEDEAESDSSSSRSALLGQPIGGSMEPPDPTLYPESMENTAEGGTPCTEDTETVVCVPMAARGGGLFEGMTQEALGQVVAAGCPSQVIIIAGPGYEALAAEGIQLDMADGSSREEPADTVMEAVPAFTEIEDQEGKHNASMTMSEEHALYTLQEEHPEEAEDPRLVLSACLPDTGSLQEAAVAQPMERLQCQPETVLQLPKEPEKKRSRRPRVADADGVLEMLHCPYEGCAQVYTSLHSFQNHVNLVHRKGRTKVCPEPGCGKKFYLSNHLHRHMIIHTGAREFVCETCGKSFKRKSHLEVHRRTHTGETPLQCEVCGYQCRQRASLNWHMKKHGSAIQYSFSCEQCGKLFEKPDSVKFHKLKSHPEGGVT
ncbi:zinc finger protein 653 [Hyperolius riggenbachi]|uniref:zinc finger protein 653 n=1 Tax=Hyperolius riggenbachi TaxID=752182 RepID=UPI0035A27025